MSIKIFYTQCTAESLLRPVSSLTTGSIEADFYIKEIPRTSGLVFRVSNCTLVPHIKH